MRTQVSQSLASKPRLSYANSELPTCAFGAYLQNGIRLRGGVLGAAFVRDLHALLSDELGFISIARKPQRGKVRMLAPAAGICARVGSDLQRAATGQRRFARGLEASHSGRRQDLPAMGPDALHEVLQGLLEQYAVKHGRALFPRRQPTPGLRSQLPRALAADGKAGKRR